MHDFDEKKLNNMGEIKEYIDKRIEEKITNEFSFILDAYNVSI